MFKTVSGKIIMASLLICCTAAAFDLMLITEYADSTQLRLSEDGFQQIIKSTRPNGMKLLNELKPSDFRQNLFLRKADVVFSSGAPY